MRVRARVPAALGKVSTGEERAVRSCESEAGEREASEAFKDAGGAPIPARSPNADQGAPYLGPTNSYEGPATSFNAIDGLCEA